MSTRPAEHDLPLIISVDDHVVEPPDLFLRWLPSRWRDDAPRVVQLPWEMSRHGRHWPFRPAADGPETDFWAFEDLRVVVPTAVACAGRDPAQLSYEPVSYAEMRPGFYDVSSRLDDMTINHVERSLCFPTFARFCGQTFLEARNRALALACVRGYNDWMVEEWSGDSGGRLIPLCLVPLWDPIEAANEVRRNAARGVRAMAFSELPSALGLPSIHDASGHWDPLFAACEETGTVVCMHIGSSSQMPTTSDDAPVSVRMAATVLNSISCLADWLLSGVLPRFPRLKIALSEAQVGWMPFLFERVDAIYNKGTKLSDIHPSITQPPSSYVPGRVYGCLFDDRFGVRSHADIGIDQLTFETDYPHQDSTWPHSKDAAAAVVEGLSSSDAAKILRDNAIRMLDLPEVLPVGAGGRRGHHLSPEAT